MSYPFLDASAARVLTLEGQRAPLSRLLLPSFPICYGPEFVAEKVRSWIAAVGAKTAFIESGSPWENGYIESFNARLRDELLSGEIFYSLKEAQILIEQWRRHYNTVRPHSALGFRPPAPETFIPMDHRPVMHQKNQIGPPIRGSPGSPFGGSP
jgi:hypothetical protein